MKQKYVENAYNAKVFLNLKRIKKALQEKYLEEVSVGIVVSGENQYHKRSNKNMRKNIQCTPMGEKFTCPICQNTIIRQFKNDVVLDHSHKDGKIRGWICRQCNSSIGMLDEDINILQRAIKWLKGQLTSFFTLN